MTLVYHAGNQRTTQFPLFPPTKVCRACGKEKSLDEFHQHRESTDGRRSICKECRKTSNKLPTIVLSVSTKVCATCGTEKDLDEFIPKAEGKYGRSPHCRECINAEARAKTAAKHANDAVPREGYKFCLACDEEKLLKAFEAGRNQCIECRIAYRKTRYHQQKDTPEYKAYRKQYTSTPEYAKRNQANVYRWQKTERGRELHNAYSRRVNKTPRRQAFDRKRRATPEHQQYQHDYAQKYAKEHPEKVKEQRMRRIAREREATVEKVDYEAILVRDGYICHICGQAIDPTLKKGRGKLHFDHVTPLQPRKGEPQGTHSASNIRPSHQCCNNRKSNKPVWALTAYDRRGPYC